MIQVTISGQGPTKQTQEAIQRLLDRLNIQARVMLQSQRVSTYTAARMEAGRQAEKKFLEILQKHPGEFIRREVIAEHVGITAPSLATVAQRLRARGYAVIGDKRRGGGGYALMESVGSN